MIFSLFETGKFIIIVKSKIIGISVFRLKVATLMILKRIPEQARQATLEDLI